MNILRKHSEARTVYSDIRKERLAIPEDSLEQLATLTLHFVQRYEITEY